MTTLRKKPLSFSVPRNGTYKASLIGTSTREAVDSLLKEHAFHHLRQCQGILRLGDTYGEERLEQACARANAFGDPC